MTQRKKHWAREDEVGVRPARRRSREERRINSVVCEQTLLPERSKILLAEDDDEMRNLMASMLRASGYHVIEVIDGRELLRAISRRQVGPIRSQPDLIVSDVRMPRLTGLEVLQSLRSMDWAMPVILITAFGDVQTHEEARRLGAAVILDKPFELQDLERAVHDILPPLL